MITIAGETIARDQIGELLLQFAEYVIDQDKEVRALRKNVGELRFEIRQLDDLVESMVRKEES